VVVAERVPQGLATGVDLRFDGPEEPIPIASNEVLTQEIVANLVDNAIRYNREGGAVIVRVIITAGASRKSGSTNSARPPGALQTEWPEKGAIKADSSGYG
jgi:signal transduction histidine kinase